MRALRLSVQVGLTLVEAKGGAPADGRQSPDVVVAIDATCPGRR